MKSRRRHELQKNVLQKELGKVGEFFRKYSTFIVWGGVVAALVLLVAVYSVTQRRDRQREIHSRYEQAMNDRTLTIEERLTNLKALAEQDTDTDIAAQACLRVADQSASRLARARSSTPKADRKSYGDLAETYYRKAIAGFGDRPMTVGRAHLGLASLAETRRDFDAAEVEYQMVLAMPQLQGSPLAEAATRRMKALDDLRSLVLMATTAPAPRKKKNAGTEEGLLPPLE